MKNRFILITCTFRLLCSTGLFAQSRLSVKIGYGSGLLVDYGALVGQFKKDWKDAHSPMKFRPGIGIQYRSLVKDNISWCVDAGINWHTFKYSGWFGGIGRGVVIDGDFDIIQGYAVIGESIRCSPFLDMRFGLGALLQLYAQTNAKNNSYGLQPPLPEYADVNDYFKKLLPVAELALSVPIHRFSLECSLQHPIFRRYANMETRTGYLPQLVIWRVSLLYLIRNY